MRTGSSDGRLRVVIVAPVFQDWDCASTLCRDLDSALGNTPELDMRIVLVDDGSPCYLQGWTAFEPLRVHRIECVRLWRNLGHQRAIAAGLCYVRDNISCDAVLVMDCDGEDRPEDATVLVRKLLSSEHDIIFAERGRRMEGLIFQIGYMFFRKLHRLLTGVPVSVGNFSIVSRHCLDRLVCMSELWNHYAGAVFRSRIPFDRVRIDRGPRYSGRSHMNIVSLVSHGISGIATFYETVATRLLLFNAIVGAALLCTIALVIAVRITTSLAVPGWATFTTGLLLVMVTQLAATSFSLVFSLIVSRTNMLTIPSRDYSLFVQCTDLLWHP